MPSVARSQSCYIEVMEENPYQAPGGGQSPLKPQRSRRAIWVVGITIGIGIGFVLAIVLAIVVAVVAFSTIDFRENPRFWDEVERRKKMGMTEEEAARTIHEEQDARRDKRRLDSPQGSID